MIILKLRDERKNKEIETTQRRMDNWLSKCFHITQKDNQFVDKATGRVYYTILSRESQPRQKHNWLYELRFWVHGTFEGDDIECRVKFKYHPTKIEVKKIIKKSYLKYCMEPDTIYENMGNDWKLWDLSTTESVEPK